LLIVVIVVIVLFYGSAAHHPPSLDVFLDLQRRPRKRVHASISNRLPLPKMKRFTYRLLPK